MIASVPTENAALPGPEREVLALLAESGLGYAGVAELLGITPTDVGALAAAGRLRLARAEPVPEGCAAQLPRLTGLLDGEALPAPEHSAACSSCAAALEAMREADATYRAWQPGPMPGRLRD